MAAIAKPTDFVNIEDVAELLDFVFEGLEEFSDRPSLAEYHKLQRIMKVMLRFYVKGSATKKQQLDEVSGSMGRLEEDMRMTEAQLEALRPFPMAHPKKKSYFDGLMNEMENLHRTKDVLDAKVKELSDLYNWSVHVVAAVTWLEDNIEDYCNHILKISPPLDVKFPVHEIPTETLERHRKALDEITYNLHESQDFFDASLDGRLAQFHQLEKCMIEAQLKVLAAFPEDSPRRQYEESELKNDLQFVVGNMEESPKRLEHRRRMREMHRDFYRVLRWQRRKVKKQLGVADETDAKEEKDDEAQWAQEDALRAGNGGLMPVCPVGKFTGQLPSIGGAAGCPLNN